MWGFSRRQVASFIVFSVADFCVAICFSLQAPFYPQEAEKKGATTAEYGLVFGIYELVCFIVSPIYGHYVHRVGPKVLFNVGILTSGISVFLFGFLNRVEGHYAFIGLSFLCRIAEALGNAGFIIAIFSLIATEFPDNVATTFATLETFFGLGMIVGPTVGGALYQVGGFTTPFVTVGILLLLTALLSYFLLPDHSNKPVTSNTGVGLLELLRIPGVALTALSTTVTSMSIGFLSATLEPHLRQFELSPISLGFMFIVDGGMYAVTTPFWGWLCDKKMSPKGVILTGCVLLVIGYSLIGPAPYIPTPQPGSTVSLSFVIAGLVIHGVGVGAMLVASFTDALKTSIASGFANNLETYGLVSGLWTSTFAFGNFVGPSVSGFLYDLVGFSNATIVIVVLGCIVGVIVSIFLAKGKDILKKGDNSEEVSEILCEDDNSRQVRSYGSVDSA